MNNASTVLVVDDDQDVLRAARLALSSGSTQVEVLHAPSEVKAAIEGGAFDALLIDMNFGDGRRDGQEGLDLLQLTTRLDPTLGVVLMTSFAGVTLAVDALKRGAVDFIMKPWRNSELVEAVARASELTRNRRREEQLSLDTVERRAIERTLERNHGNVSLSAAALGISRAALYRRMAKHAL
jgi:DNA-binding NtrC family response regulator